MADHDPIGTVVRRESMLVSRTDGEGFPIVIVSFRQRDDGTWEVDSDTEHIMCCGRLPDRPELQFLDRHDGTSRIFLGMVELTCAGHRKETWTDPDVALRDAEAALNDIFELEAGEAVIYFVDEKPASALPSREEDIDDWIDRVVLPDDDGYSTFDVEDLRLAVRERFR